MLLFLKSLSLFGREGRHTVCGWEETDLTGWKGDPGCQAITAGSHSGMSVETQNGTLLRMLSCELSYGPLNCDFKWGSNQ